jgi:hypothetical protein
VSIGDDAGPARTASLLGAAGQPVTESDRVDLMPGIEVDARLDRPLRGGRSACR